MTKRELIYAYWSACRWRVPVSRCPHVLLTDLAAWRCMRVYDGKGWHVHFCCAPCALMLAPFGDPVLSN